MLKNYFKIAFRNLLKYKGYSFINIIGLAIGLTCALFIYIWVQDELSYDTYNENAENIYRVEEDQYYSGEIFHVTVTPYPVAPAFKEKIPEVENAARIRWKSVLLSYGDKTFYETDVVGLDSTYLEMFTFDFVRGDKYSALDKPNSIIMCEESAEKYFGKDDPIGKTIRLNNKYDFNVTGVFKKLPHNVSYSFEIGFPFEFLKELGGWSESWTSNSITTFLQLVPGADEKAVNKKMTDLLRENAPESTTDFMVAPLLKIHLYSYWGFGHSPGKIQNVYIFSVIGIFIMLIACINFMNLTTARSANRAKEIGMRKVTGAQRRSLITQFYGESVLLAFIGLVIAAAVVLLLLKEFNDFTDKEILLNHLLNWDIILGAFAITIITGILAGSYPALYLSAFKPVSVLKGEMTKGKQSSLFRKILVVIQFSLSVFLIIGTIAVYNQMVYMKDKDLGFDKEHVVYFTLRGNLTENYQSLKREFQKTAGALNITGSNHRPNLIGSNSGGADWDGKDPEQRVLIGQAVVDYHYVKTMGIEMLEGRDFLPEFPADIITETDTLGGFLVNEEVVKIMNTDYKSAIGARFDFMGAKGQIVGVMKNFHYGSVKNKIEPLAFALAPDYIDFLVVRLSPGNVSEKLSSLEDAWGNVVSNYPFEYKFLDEDFDKMYRSEERMVALLKIFALVAIAIACLGLFGLASFTAEQKTKEVGIRKVLGASEINLVYLLCREFVILVFVSNIIAWPAAFYLVDRWLSDFAYRVDFGVKFFILAGVASLIIAVMTVGYQAIKSAISNPVDALKYE